MSEAIAALPEIAAAVVETPAAFAEIVRAAQPAVIRKAVAHWPAVDAGRSPAAMNAYLKAMDAGQLAPVMEAPAQSGGRFVYTEDLREFNFSKRQRGVGETLDQIERQIGDPKASYVAIQMLPVATHMPDFARQNAMPLLPPQIAPRLWVGGAVRTQTHNDRDHNLACVAAGRRRFLLFPPEEVGNLYVGPLENPPPLSLADPDAPDFARFPKFRDALAAARVAYLDPGDAIFIPKYWWHHVASLAPYNVLVNYWWGDVAAGLDRANECFLTALLALKDLPPGERAYWQAMFTTYVFGGGEAVAHIPPALQGALGPMRPEQRARLRQALKSVYLRG